MHNSDAKLILITFVKLPTEFTQWMDQLYGDEWFIRQGQWLDDRPKRHVTKVYALRPTNAEQFEMLARIKFPELF